MASSRRMIARGAIAAHPGGRPPGRGKPAVLVRQAAEAGSVTAPYARIQARSLETTMRQTTSPRGAASIVAPTLATATDNPAPALAAADCRTLSYTELRR